MEGTPPPAAGFVAAGLTILAAVPFLRRAVGGVTVDLPVGEAGVITLAVTLAAVAAGRTLPIPPGARAAFVLLVGSTLLGGLTAEPVAFLAGLLPVLAVAAAGVLDMTPARHAAAALLPEPVELESSKSCPTSPVSEIAEPLDDESEFLAGSQAVAAAAEPSLRIDRETGPAGERLSGRLEFEMPPGETVRTLHVPLWPPLAADPVAACELDDLDGRVRVTLAKRYGLRIEVRLPEAADEPLTGAVRFSTRPATPSVTPGR